MAEVELVERKVVCAFSKAVTETLSGMGQSVQTAVLYHIEKSEGIPQNKILRNPPLFSHALKKIFGSGSSIIENKIINSMCLELGIRSQLSGSFEQKIALIYEIERKASWLSEYDYPRTEVQA